MGLSSGKHSNTSLITSEHYYKLLFEYHTSPVHLLFVSNYPVMISWIFLASSHLRERNPPELEVKMRWILLFLTIMRMIPEEGTQTGN
jgi:hypothetical protein